MDDVGLGPAFLDTGGNEALYNANSIMLRVHRGANTFLFPGDNHGIAAQSESIGSEKLKCDVLVVPHHGLNSSPAMAAATRPKIVAIASLPAISRSCPMDER